MKPNSIKNSFLKEFVWSGLHELNDGLTELLHSFDERNFSEIEVVCFGFSQDAKNLKKDLMKVKSDYYNVTNCMIQNV
jgi:hypothetical protein